MNLIGFIHKELHAAWDEVSSPLFPEGSENDEFYTELFNYYHSLQGKTIDTSRGESLFPAIADNTHPVSRQHLHIIKEKLSEISVPAGFDERNWKTV